MMRAAGTAPPQPLPIGRLAASIRASLAHLWQARTGAARQMRLVETLPLAPGRSLALVEIGEQRFLVALGKDTASTPLLLGAQPEDVRR